MPETQDIPTVSKTDLRITSLYLGNFKAFGPTQKVPLRPLTVVYGPNSSGKSSIIHGLLFGHEALTSKKSNNLDVHRPQIGGESVDLGGFRQFVFRRDPANRVEWGCELDVARLPESRSGMLVGARSVVASATIQSHRYSIPARPNITIGDLADKLGVPVADVLNACIPLKKHIGRVDARTELEGLFQLVVELQIRKAQLEKAKDPDAVPDLPDVDAFLANQVVRDEDGLAVQVPRVSGYTITVDGADVLKASLKGSGLDWRMRIDVIDTDHSVVKHWLRAFLDNETLSSMVPGEGVELLKQLLDELIPLIELERGTFLPTGLSASSLQRIAETSTVQESARALAWDKQVRLLFPRELSRLVSLVAEAVGVGLTHDRTGVHYLGPLRSYPPRHLAVGEDENGNWLAGGGFAWDVVRHDAEIRRRVNQWLGADFMKTPYELAPQLLYDIEDLEKSFDEVVEGARRDERLKYFEELCGNMGEEFTEVIQEEEIIDPVLSVASRHVADDLDLARKGKWPPQEGVADFDQLMDVAKRDVEPIRDLWLIDKRTSTKVSHRDVGIGVSQVLPVVVSAFASKNAILAMEQPELHLHPALQAELADVFIESAIKGQNTFLLETHSEHLLLRIMRRMRETANGSLPEGHVPVRPEDVMVLYVEPESAGSIVREMPLNEQGALVKAWPGGFFEEGLREVF